MALRRACLLGLQRAGAVRAACMGTIQPAPAACLAQGGQWRGFGKKAARHKGGAAPSAQHSGEHHHHAPASSGDQLLDVNSLRSKMDKVLQVLERDFAGIRGGKADAGMFDHVQVKAYGKPTPLGEVAQVTIKSPTLAVINVYDGELVEAVNAALKEAKLDLMPRVEGNALTVPLPKPSAEMRESLVKLAQQHAEKAKQNIRKVRREGLDGLKSAKDSASEDEVRRTSKVVEALTDEVVKKAADLLEKKKKHILTV